MACRVVSELPRRGVENQPAPLDSTLDMQPKHSIKFTFIIHSSFSHFTFFEGEAV